MNLMRTRTRRAATEGDSDERMYPACRDCGVVVTDSDAVLETLHAEGLTVLLGRQKLSHEVVRPQDVIVSRCAACETRRRRAAELVDAHQRAVPYLRSHSLRVDAADRALMVFELLGLSWRELLDEGTDRVVHHTIESLRGAGGALAYSNSILPIVQLGFGDGVPATATTRWAHVSPDAAQAARDAYAGFLADRIDGPRQVPPPDSDGFNDAMRGCLFCGVRTVTAASRRAWNIWGEMHRAKAHTLGGPGEPGYRRGYLCPVCRKSFERVGAIGMNALELALAVHLGVSVETFERIDSAKYENQHQQGIRLGFLREAPGAKHAGPPLSGGLVPIPAWCALPEGTPPNAKPWAHLGDLSKLAQALQKL